MEKTHPFELKEIILTEATDQLFDVTNRMTQPAEVYTLVTLISPVSLLWWRTYRSHVRHLLKGYFRKVCHPFKYTFQQVSSLHPEGDRGVSGVVELNSGL